METANWNQLVRNFAKEKPYSAEMYFYLILFFSSGKSLKMWYFVEYMCRQGIWTLEHLLKQVVLIKTCAWKLFFTMIAFANKIRMRILMLSSKHKKIEAFFWCWNFFFKFSEILDEMEIKFISSFRPHS